ncbi:unnamed protein product [Didymodactylos carnosus]|uniref:N-acetylgalactosaminide beta-1,3-galactosyltransferase n=1 Tax=Didymodactylos carnosus TaxID=1234261 RepID=A0A8S2PKA1_9BILA|nr:unnamed protein product [Didymodactylos carnosus]CAF4058427.1 unnamed protein product [Didymodactylos carnosus]
MILRWFLLCYISIQSSGTDHDDFIILFLSQPHAYLLSQLHDATRLIHSQQHPLTQIFPHIKVSIVNSHDYANNVTNWYSIYPLFSTLLTTFNNLKFLFICEVETRVNLVKLVEFSKSLSRSVFVGHGLINAQQSIIHHYSIIKDYYPDPSAGILISSDVLALFVERDRQTSYSLKIGFIIDTKFELAKMISELTEVKMTDRSDLFCNQRQPSPTCITWNDWITYSCRSSNIRLIHIYFGIKTFYDFHQQRVSLLKRTWLSSLKNVNYNLFSNKKDPSFENILVLNDENTLIGHCHKTFSLLNYFNNTINDQQKYLVVVDDDTLVSVSRLLSMIQCFMLNDDVPLVLGERYGYSTYPYPTAGSGMIFNRQAVKLIIEKCSCPEANTPDDMYIGICLQQLTIPLIHIKELHQAQTIAYSSDWLKHQKPISFHKFDNIDVEYIYKTHLHETVVDTQKDEL